MQTGWIQASCLIFNLFATHSIIPNQKQEECQGF